MKKMIAAKNQQLGQTLIETLVAIFILLTGLISAISLAVYSYKSIDNSSKQIVAASLASESLEAIKNIRDTNWLNDTLVNCAYLGTNQKCYANWRGSGSSRLDAGDYIVDFSSSGGIGSWVLSRNPPVSAYRLNYDSVTGQYHSGGTGSPSVFSRDVKIVDDNTAPYTGGSPRLIVTSTVWWTSRNCPATIDPSTLSNSCKVIEQIYLTNWKNY
ncbi:MAG: hypothetical protein NVSMB66_4080 [Candidatus Doudnabacteria bacterium]